MQKLNAVCINTRDNVVTAIEDIPEGGTVYYAINTELRSLIVKENVNFCHKIALKEIKKGEPIYKYGEQIGAAAQDIMPGQHVHVQNIVSNRGRGDLC
ncbi:MAG: UxaA family hydrolase [Synergistaceae bacterium]|nr:UxaA family hydrolase [Synergistaceae bacterium]